MTTAYSKPQMCPILEKILQEQGLTQTALACLLDIPLARLQHYLYRRRRIPLELAVRLEDIVGYPVRQWVGKRPQP
jgi:plasmid maintenance system antidote protein VapI